MAEREIVSIVWHESDDQVDLVYAQGEADRLVGHRIVVAELAESAGLVVVPGPPRTICWAREPRPGE